MANNLGFKFINGTPYVYQETASGSSSASGIDANDGDIYKIQVQTTPEATVSASAQIIVDPATNGNIDLNPNGTGFVRVSTSLDLPHADDGSAQGYVRFNDIKFLHNYGTLNTFIGESAGNSTLTPGSSIGNTCGGSSSGGALTTGALNTLYGQGAGLNITSGNNNCAFGEGALASATSSNSTALGFNTLGAYHPASGDTGQVAVGFDCLQSVTTGTECTAIGAECGQNLTSANKCTLIGRQCCDVSTSIGDGNICIGYRCARSSVLGVDNLIIGNLSGINYVLSEDNNILINNLGTASDSGALRIGTQGNINTAYVAGITGVDVGSVADVVSIDTSTGQLGTTTLTAGSNVTITPGSGTITIAASGGGGGISWTNISGSSSTLAGDNYYYVTYTSGTAALSMPSTMSAGQVIKVVDATAISGGSGGFTLSFSPSQGLQFYNNNNYGFPGVPFDVAVGNTFDNQGGYVEILCVADDTLFVLLGSAGNITINA